MSHFSVLRVECVILVSSEFSIQNDVFIPCFSSWEFALSLQLSGLWLWIVAVNVVCVMFGHGLVVYRVVSGMKL